MAEIKSAPLSFIRFEDLEDAYCPGLADYVLPALSKHEAKFQFIVDGYLSDAEKIKLGVSGVAFAPAVYAELLDYKYKVDSLVNLQNPFYVSVVVFGSQQVEYNLVFTAAQFLQALEDDFGIVAYFDGVYLVFVHTCKQCFKVFSTQDDVNFEWMSEDYFWNQGYVEAPAAVDVPATCFFYSLFQEGEPDVLLGNSNNFHKKDDCYSSLLTYSCDEDAFDFYYSGGHVNQVRLPFYLSRPTHPQKKDVYINSKGTHKILSAFVEKEYLLQTDWMIELFHECMAIALSHDTVIIKNSNIREKTVQVISSDGYTPEWNNEHELLQATGKGKVRVKQFGYTNSNCDIEEEEDCLDTCDKEVNITSVTLEDGEFKFIWTCTNNDNHDASFKIEWFDGDAWIEVPWSLISTIFLTGNVEALANGIPTDQPVDFRITPMCCNTAGTSSTISWQLCPTITNLAIGDITDESAEASWTAAAAPAIQYEIVIFRADTPGVPLAGYPLLLDPGITSHFFIGLEAGTAYQFAVRSFCGDGNYSPYVDLPADPDFETLP